MTWGQGYPGYKDDYGYGGQAISVYRKGKHFWYRTICQGSRPKDGGVRKEVCVYLIGLD